MNLQQYIDESEWIEYDSALTALIDGYEFNGSINEGLIDTLSKSLKSGIEFIKDLARIIGSDFISLLKLFKERVIFTFFKKIKWSIKELSKLVKKGYKLWSSLHSLIAKYAAENKIVKWTGKNLAALDDWLNKHPLIKKNRGTCDSRVLNIPVDIHD